MPKPPPNVPQKQQILTGKLNSLQHLIRTTAAKSQNTANITKDYITSHHIAEMLLCCEVISSFVIFTVLVLRLCHCRPYKVL